jgi:superfamily II DNA or RNA helicase
VSQFVRLYLHHGSVNAIHNVLKGTDTEKTIYPNRIHGLLSDEPSKSVRTATLEAIEDALGQVDVPSERLSAVGGGEVYNNILREYQSRKALLDGQDPGNAIDDIADHAGAPKAVVRMVLEEAGAFDEEGPTNTGGRQGGPSTPDWSFQDQAVQACVQSLLKGEDMKSGLVVPTGGGKTRIAIRVIIEMLARADRQDTVALWVTHRRQLKKQAKRELQRVINDEKVDLPDNATQLLDERLEFVMRSDIQDTLWRRNTGEIELVVVDEGHHAAAPSYQPIFDHTPLRGLFLTATPNRADNLPIGIDEIAYRITYRELFDQGVIVEPTFEELSMDGFNWADDEQVEDLANDLINRARGRHKKILVAVTTVDYTRRLRSALVRQLRDAESHPLDEEDIGYVHGSGSTMGAAPLDYIDEFNARPRGILVATSQLVGEGYDDSSIDTVVVTYESSSIGHLMQVAGRALRYDPGKDRAYVLQLRDSKVTYHFEQGWLYQTISDRLRPQLEHVSYSNADDLEEKVNKVLEWHNASDAVRGRILSQVGRAEGGKRFNLLLTGLPFYGDPDQFEEEAEWGGLFVGPDERARFRTIFNEYSDLGEEIEKPKSFLRQYVNPNSVRGSQWKGYRDMLDAMDQARKEVLNDSSEAAQRRNYDPSSGTSWLKYYTFEYRPDLPPELDEFLKDAINRDDVAQQYLQSVDDWMKVLKVPLPLTGTKAYLLSEEQAEWFQAQREGLIGTLSESEVGEEFDMLDRWRRTLARIPVPTLIVRYFDRFLRAEEHERYVLDLNER